MARGAVPSSIPPSGLVPGRAAPVAVPAAAADLLEEDDPRARHAAAVDLQYCLDALRAAGWLDHIHSGPDGDRERFGKSTLVGNGRE